MMVTYPADWHSLSQPRVRSELLAFLKSAAAPDLFADESELEALVHFIYDDHDFAPDAKAMIGRVLFDLAEADALNAFTAALDSAMGEGRVWPLDIDEDQAVRDSAAEAHELLMRRGAAAVGK